MQRKRYPSTDYAWHNRGKSIILLWLRFYHFFPTQKIMKIAAIRSIFTTKNSLNYFFSRARIPQGEFTQTCSRLSTETLLSTLVLTPSASQFPVSLAPQLPAPRYTAVLLIIKSRSLCMRFLVFKISSEENNYTHSNFTVTKHRY